jgi:hypothetical protein
LKFLLEVVFWKLKFLLVGNGGPAGLEDVIASECR